MKQSAAVVQFYMMAIATTEEGGAGLPNDKTNAQTRAFVVGKLEEGLADGSINWSGDRRDPKAVTTYAKALVGNGFKKHKDLNGGGDFKYVPQTKRGPQDKNPEVVELKENLKSLKAHNGDMTIIRRCEERIQTLHESEKAAKKQGTVRPLDEALASLAEAGILIAD